MSPHRRDLAPAGPPGRASPMGLAWSPLELSGFGGGATGLVQLQHPGQLVQLGTVAVHDPLAGPSFGLLPLVCVQQQFQPCEPSQASARRLRWLREQDSDLIE